MITMSSTPSPCRASSIRRLFSLKLLNFFNNTSRCNCSSVISIVSADSWRKRCSAPRRARASSAGVNGFVPMTSVVTVMSPVHCSKRWPPLPSVPLRVVVAPLGEGFGGGAAPDWGWGWPWDGCPPPPMPAAWSESRLDIQGWINLIFN